MNGRQLMEKIVGMLLGVVEGACGIVGRTLWNISKTTNPEYSPIPASKVKTNRRSFVHVSFSSRTDIKLHNSLSWGPDMYCRKPHSFKTHFLERDFYMLWKMLRFPLQSTWDLRGSKPLKIFVNIPIGYLA